MEDQSEAPPLPQEEVAPPLPPEPPLPEEVPKPPMPVHMSNQKHERLDFDCGDGDHVVHQICPEAPVAKRPRLEYGHESDAEPSEQDISKNLAMNIEVANAMLAAIANEIKTEDKSPSSVEDGELLSSDNEPGEAVKHSAAEPGLNTHHQTIPAIKPEQYNHPQPHNHCVSEPTNVSDNKITNDSGAGDSVGAESAAKISANSETFPSEDSTVKGEEQPADPERVPDLGGGSAKEAESAQRQFCPFDVGSHRKPVSQIPVAPPSDDCESTCSIFLHCCLANYLLWSKFKKKKKINLYFFNEVLK